MTRHPRSRAAKRARARQKAGDTRPYMVILHEEKVREMKEDGMAIGKSVRTVTSALKPEFEENEE
jgi:hypothetical protein